MRLLLCYWVPAFAGMTRGYMLRKTSSRPYPHPLLIALCPAAGSFGLHGSNLAKPGLDTLLLVIRITDLGS